MIKRFYYASLRFIFEALIPSPSLWLKFDTKLQQTRKDQGRPYNKDAV